MSKLAGEARRQLTDLVVQLITPVNTESHLEHLNLCGFSLTRSDIAVGHGQTILESLIGPASSSL